MVKICSRQSRMAASSDTEGENGLRSLYGNILSQIEKAQADLSMVLEPSV